MITSNNLTVLAAKVKDSLAASAAAERSSIEAALEAGKALCEAKDACKHGGWLPFLEEAGVQERKAQRYMQLARSGLKSDTVSDLGGIKATLKWLERLPELPDEQHCVHVECGELSAVVWHDGAGHRYMVWRSADTWVDTLRRPIIKPEHVYRFLFNSLDDRCAEMRFDVGQRLPYVDEMLSDGQTLGTPETEEARAERIKLWLAKRNAA